MNVNIVDANSLRVAVCKVKQNEDNKRSEIFERLIILEEKNKKLDILEKDILEKDNKELKNDK